MVCVILKLYAWFAVFYKGGLPFQIALYSFVSNPLLEGLVQPGQMLF